MILARKILVIVLLLLFAFSLRPALRTQILSEMRLLNFRPFIGEGAYARGFADSLGLSAKQYIKLKAQGAATAVMESCRELYRKIGHRP